MSIIKCRASAAVAFLYCVAACSFNSHIRENELLVAQGRHRQAMENYRALVAESPDNAEYHYRIAKLYLSRQEYEPALHAVEKALLLAPNQARYRLLAGKCHYLRKEYFHAIAQSTSALVLDNEILDAYRYLALSYDQAGNFEEAVRQLNLALALEPLYFEGHLALASIRFRRRTAQTNYEALIEQLEKALLIAPFSVPGNILLSDMYYAVGESHRAKAILQAHIAANGDRDETLYALARIEYQSGRYQEAADALQKIATRNLAAQLLDIKIKAELAPRSELKSPLEKLMAENPDNVEIHLFGGILAYRAGNVDRAERLFQTVLKIDPANGEAYFQLSKIWRDRNDFVGFGNSLKKAFSLEPGNLEIFAAYLQMLIEQDEWERASYLLERRQLGNRNSTILYIRGLIAKAKGKFYEAQELFEKSRQQRFSAAVETQIADMEIRRGHYQSAEKRIRLVLRTEPRDVDTVLVLSQLFFRRQQIDRIPPLLTPYLSDPRGRGRVHLQLAEAWVQLDRMDEAVAMLEEGLEIWPRHPELAQVQTLYLGVMGEYRKAIRILEEMQTFEHKYNRLFHYRLSGYYHKTGDRETFKQYLYRYNLRKELERYSHYLYRYILRQNLACSNPVP